MPITSLTVVMPSIRIQWRREAEALAGQKRTPDIRALSPALAAAQPGDQVMLTVARGAQHLTVRVTLGELPGS